MEPGYAEGFLIGIFLCVMIVLCLFLANKRSEKRIKNLLSDLPEEVVVQLTNTGYVTCESNSNFMYGISYIYKIKQKNGGVNIVVLYYEPPQNSENFPYKLDYLYMNQTDYNRNKSQIKEGALVKTIHNRISMPYKICKIDL